MNAIGEDLQVETEKPGLFCDFNSHASLDSDDSFVAFVSRFIIVSCS